MSAPYQLVTFDVYTALFDIETSLVPQLAAVLDNQVEATTFLRTWRSKQLEYAILTNSLGRGRVSFRVATRRALEHTLAKFGISISAATAEAFIGEWDRLRPWPEVEQVLREVKARGFQMGVLSNGDSEMLHKLIGTLTVTVDYLFSSEQAGYYKPHPAVYRLPLNALNLKPEQVLHVAGSATDVMGTKSAGLTCYWSNRLKDRVVDPTLQPDYEFENLLGLLEIL